MTGHTAGKWFVDLMEFDPNFVIGPRREDGNWIATKIARLEDAQLIAAAPLLMEALKEARELCAELENCGDYKTEGRAGEILARIDAAIRRANGTPMKPPPTGAD